MRQSKYARSWVITSSIDANTPRRSAQRRRGVVVAAVEVLECRKLLASIVVNSTADTASPPVNTITLRSAIAAANSSTSPTTITFDPTVFATPQTITMSNGAFQLHNSSDAITITGPAAGVTLAPGYLSVGFTISSGQSASISNLTIYEGSGVGAEVNIGTGASATLNNVSMRNGVANGNGGAVYVGSAAKLTMINCTVSGNLASDGSGGGVYVAGGTANILNTTISGNSSADGGGIENVGGTLNIANSTVAANEVSGSGSGVAGGGIATIGNGTTFLSSDTIALNLMYAYADLGFPAPTVFGAGLYAEKGSTVSLQDTIVAKNTNSNNPDDLDAIDPTAQTPTDIAGVFKSNGYNLIGFKSASFTATAGDETNTSSTPLDPQFFTPPAVGYPTTTPLYNFGGNTLSLLPASTSPAVDHGSNALAVSTDGVTALTTDERGSARIVNGTVDIGADESPIPHASGTYNVTGLTDGAGSISGAGPFNASTLRAAVIAADYGGGSSTINLPAGTYTLNNPSLGALEIFSNINLVGSGSSSTIINAAGLGNFAFYVQATNGSVDTISGVSIENAVAAYYTAAGAVIFDSASGVTSGVLNLTNDLITKNAGSGDGTSGFGGGITVGGGTLNLTGSTVSNNTAGGGYFTDGGGIALGNGTANILDSTISGNSANFGGGIENEDGTLNVSNSTIVSNSATEGQGGGIATTDDGTTFLSNDTIAFNTVPTGDSGTPPPLSGAGLYAEKGSAVSLQNTIVAKNTNQSSPDDLDAIDPAASTPTETSGIIVSKGDNLIGVGNSSFTPTTGDQVGTAGAPIDPLFTSTSPQNNGGPTATLLPGNGSPAIDKGSNALAVGTDGKTPLTTDQRGSGYSRIFNSTVDIGAVESTGATTPVTIKSFTIDNGTAQRSRVRTVTIAFSAAVTLDSGAFTLTRTSGTPTPVTYTATTSDGGATYVITPTSGLTGGSLVDGNYSLVVHASAVHPVSSPSSTLGGSDVTYTFFRLFGDSNGDGTVNLADYRAFAASYLKSAGNTGYNAAFDTNNDGTINLVDYRAFAANYLKSITT